MLPANRHSEAVECWKILDDLYGGNAPWGSLQRIVLRAVQGHQGPRRKSITLGALFDAYVEQAPADAVVREDYVKQFGWLRG